MTACHTHTSAPQETALVCVVDDDCAMRTSLERLFRSSGYCVETFSSAAAFLARPPHPGPVCLVLDIQMPGLSGFDLQASMVGRMEQIVFLTGHGDMPMCVHAMKAGAVDFLTKPADACTLLQTVASALQRAIQCRAEALCQSRARALLATLTKRERQVMQFVIDGHMNKHIAADLGIAEKTVKIHRGRLMHKTHCASVPELLRLALKSGVVTVGAVATPE